MLLCGCGKQEWQYTVVENISTLEQALGGHHLKITFSVTPDQKAAEAK